MERCALILRDGLMRHQQRKHLPLGNRDRRQVFNRPAVAVSVAPGIIFNRQIQPAFHEVHVPLGGARRNLELLGKGPAIGMPALAQKLVHAHHALPWGPAIHIRLDLGHRPFLSGVECRVSGGECRGKSVERRGAHAVISNE